VGEMGETLGSVAGGLVIMNTLLEKAIKSGFLDLGFAKWVPNKGLQIQNLEKLNEDAPGVYIMHYKDKIQIFSNYS
jgi:hypothetical protein